MGRRVTVIDGALLLCALALTLLLARQVALRTRPQPVKELPSSQWQVIAAVGSRIGPPTAPITVTEFADFQCAACRDLAFALDELHTSHPDAFTVVYRHLPLPGHPHAREAALASECAANQGRFRAYHDLLYAKQDSIGEIAWSEFATRAGVRNMEEFTTCMRGFRTAKRLAVDSVAAESLNLAATPAFLVDGELFIGAPAKDDLARIILGARGVAPWRGWR